MSMIRLALINFKNSFRNYLSLILSLAFTILVLFNFQNLIDSEAFEVLGSKNQEYVEIIVQVISVVLGCFMFFFLWYATNVFLTKRKKEIGIYIFMGLSNRKIGKLYMIETVLIGIAALILGIGAGILTTQLFQMILLAISDISVDISFQISLRPILITTAVYLVMYLIFALKGYVNVVRSSVIEMVSAARKNEYVRQNTFVLILKAVVGVAVLSYGYMLAIKEGGQEVMGNVLAAVVLVVVGIYLLFGGFLPVLFLYLSKKKLFLYQKERNLWVNNVIFRIKKNYRTYAMTCVLMICSVTALATGVAMKFRYEAIVSFRNTYTYQFTSGRQGLDEKIRPLIEQDNEIAYNSEISMLLLDASVMNARFLEPGYVVVSYGQLKKLAEDTGLEFTLKEPGNDEIIKLSRLHMLSLLTDRSHETVTIQGKSYRQTAEANIPYLGYFQEEMSIYLVNEEEYEKLLPLGTQMRTYNYKILDMYNFAASIDELDMFLESPDGADVGRVTIDPGSSDIEWVKILHTVCIFMFMVFVLASGSILFMKLYNDAFEEKERYQVLRKLGIAKKTLKKSAACELRTAYAMPFLVMLLSARFSVHALEKMMYADLTFIYLVSSCVVLAIFILCYWCSVSVYVKNAEVE